MLPQLTFQISYNIHLHFTLNSIRISLVSLHITRARTIRESIVRLQPGANKIANKRGKNNGLYPELFIHNCSGAIKINIDFETGQSEFYQENSYMVKFHSEELSIYFTNGTTKAKKGWQHYYNTVFWILR